jgi:septum site-determining protein MinD
MGNGKGKIITIASGKGGTGKTILASNLGTALTLLGRRVVVVDADIGMADLGLYLGLEKSPITLHEVLAGEATIEQAMYDGPAGCKIIPSGLSLSGFSRANPQKLKEVADDLARTFDFIILDCGPGLSKESTIPLAVADEVIIIVNPDLASLADALRIKMMCDAVDTQIMGVVVSRSGLSKAELAPREVGSMLDLNILVDIPDDDEVRKSANLKVPVIMKKKDSPAASAQIKLAKQIAGPGATDVKVEEAPKKEKPKDSKKKRGEKKKDDKKGGKFRLFGK